MFLIGSGPDVAGLLYKQLPEHAACFSLVLWRPVFHIAFTQGRQQLRSGGTRSSVLGLWEIPFSLLGHPSQGLTVKLYSTISLFYLKGKVFSDSSSSPRRAGEGLDLFSCCFIMYVSKMGCLLKCISEEVLLWSSRLSTHWPLACTLRVPRLQRTILPEVSNKDFIIPHTSHV